jgi:putative Mg2+ transporter-C (MgtC) family protein
VIGVEREIRQKSAGLRTHTLVGVGAALFMLISKYGFNDVVQPGRVVLDPSRVAAQIVSGIGFIGAGLIFVRQEAVKGLTTAAAVWVTAAVGAAAGAGLPVLAAVATGLYLLVALVFTPLTRSLPPISQAVVLKIRYLDGRGVLRELLRVATERGFTVDRLQTQQAGAARTLALERDASLQLAPIVEVVLRVHGKLPVSELAAALADLEGVDAVVAEEGAGSGA